LQTVQVAAQVGAGVLGQGFQGGDVQAAQDGTSPGFGPELIQDGQESSQRLAAAGGSRQEQVVASGQGRPGQALGGGRFAETTAKPGAGRVGQSRQSSSRTGGWAEVVRLVRSVRCHARYFSSPTCFVEHATGGRFPGPPTSL